MQDNNNDTPSSADAEIENQTNANYKVDYRDQVAGQKYYPIAAFLGIIVAIIVGSVIIGFSIIISSGRGPASIDKLLSAKNSADSMEQVVGGTDSDAVAALDPASIELKDSYAMTGLPEAPVTIVEFADFQCPFCKEFHDNALAQIRSKYVETGKVKLYFMQFPFLGPESETSAIASECARQQGKFWEYHDALFEIQGLENEGGFSDSNLTKISQQLNLDQTKFKACQKDTNTVKAIAEQMQKGQSYGIEATPSLFINGKKVEGANPFSSYQSIIEAELNKAK